MAPDTPPVRPSPDPESTNSNAFSNISIGLVALAVVTNWALEAFKQPLANLGISKMWAWGGASVLVLVLAVLFIFVPRFRGWLKSAGLSKKTALLTFLVGPAIVAGVLSFSLMPADRQIVSLRISLIAMCSLFPGALYYLFIATRKGSLLNEFVANMARLGLLGGPALPVSPGPQEELDWETDRHRRVEAYLQRFEATYGQIQSSALAQVLPERDRSWASQRAGRTMGFGVGGLFVSDAAIPVMFATFLTALMWFTVLPLPLQIVRGILPQSLVNGAPWLQAFTPNITPVTAAFLGAYFFSLQMLFLRYVRRDLRPSAYVGMVLRILLAVIGIWIIDKTMVFGGTNHSDPMTASLPEGMNRDTALEVLGFVIGMFPHIAWQLIRGIAKRLTPGAVLPSLHSDLPISDLDGLTVWHEARLEEEDIENVPNMATADILGLMLNTRFSGDRIIDWVDQAILYTYLGAERETTPPSQPSTGGTPRPPRRQLLQAHGIRTATTLTRVYRTAQQHGDVEQFLAILPSEGRSQMRSLVDAIETNPNIRLIRMWRALPNN